MIARSKHILVVEDDVDLGNVLTEYLKLKGFDVTIHQEAESVTGDDAKRFDLAILDVMLPGINGFELAELLKKQAHRLPIIFLTARDQKKDKLFGLKIGADDYITKPFDVEELVLRITNILKRTQQGTEETLLGSLLFDAQNLLLTKKDGSKIHLTELESKLIGLLLSNQNQLLKREFILQEIWGDTDYFNGRSMDVFIARIRKYIKAEKNAELRNVRGVGFKLEIS